MSKWQVILSEFDLRFATRRSIKGSVIADHLAANPLDDDQPTETEFPDGDVMTTDKAESDQGETQWKMYFDGAVNVHGSGIGAVIIAPSGEQYPVAVKLDFECTNNIAEYEACINGLRTAIELGLKQLEVYGDSALTIYQSNRVWQTKDHKLIPYHKEVSRLVEKFEKISFNHITRDKNPFADALATLAAMIKLECVARVQPLQVSTQETPSVCAHTETHKKELPWYADIKHYILTKEYPIGASENDKKTLRRLSMAFFLSGDVLYKRQGDGVLLRCVDEQEAQAILNEVHEGICATHANGHTMVRQILRTGHYWSTMGRDCIDYVKRCHKCQVYADQIHLPATRLHLQSSPWPFALWGIDVIGAINPKASNGHKFILVAIDYFTKWVEAASYSSITQKTFLRFLRNNIICRYGLPESIITDNGTNLNGSEVHHFCEKYKIKHHNSSPYRPQMNGAVEAANKNLKKIISKMVVTYKDWHEMLPYALHGYRTTIRTSTGATPYSLVYGMEAVTPIEVEIPSLRIMIDTGLEETEWCRARYDQLSLIDEKRLTAICHGQLYQQRMAKAFNKKVRPRRFLPGDLVVKKILPNQDDHRGKWSPNYEGPFIVKQAFSGGALILTDLDGQELPKPVNSDAVKKYYCLSPTGISIAHWE